MPVMFDELYNIVLNRHLRGLPPFDEWHYDLYQNGTVYLFKEDEREVLLPEREYARLRSDEDMAKLMILRCIEDAWLKGSL